MSPTKDRLQEMRKINNGGVENEEDSGSDLGGGGKIAEAFQKAKEVRNLIQIITGNTKRANDILKSNLFKITPDLQEELDTLFRTSSATGYKIHSILLQLETDLRNVQDSLSTEHRIKSVQVASLKAEFQEALKDSSNSLEYHKNKRRELLKKALKTACKNIDEEELETLLDDDKLDVFTDNHLVSVVEAQQQLLDIEDRHKELIKIEKQLTEVLDLFVKIGSLVEQQQESVNRVEFHAAEAIEYVEKGRDDLGKTVQSRSRWRKRKICMAVIITAVISCILLIFILTK